MYQLTENKHEISGGNRNGAAKPGSRPANSLEKHTKLANQPLI